MSPSQPRNSHERNLERSLDDRSDPSRGPGGSFRSGAGDPSDAAGRRPGIAPGITVGAEMDVASRLAREAAEREAVRRASGRD